MKSFIAWCYRDVLRERVLMRLERRQNTSSISKTSFNVTDDSFGTPLKIHHLQNEEGSPPPPVAVAVVSAIVPSHNARMFRNCTLWIRRRQAGAKSLLLQHNGSSFATRILTPIQHKHFGSERNKCYPLLQMALRSQMLYVEAKSGLLHARKKQQTFVHN